MSTNSTEGGNQGQESGTATQGTGQESPQGVQGGQGQESGTQEQQGQQDGTPDLTAITDPNLRAWVEAQARQAAEARQEAARYRTERNTYQQQAQTLQQQNETEQDRITREANERQERLDALERENRDLKVGAAIQTAATDAKAFNPALVARMLDAQVTLDDKGQPNNLQDLLKDLRQSDPYLFKRADANAGEGGGQQGQPTASMNDVIRNAARARQGRTS